VSRTLDLEPVLPELPMNAASWSAPGATKDGKRLRSRRVHHLFIAKHPALPGAFGATG
jgi:hypothetical protein